MDVSEIIHNQLVALFPTGRGNDCPDNSPDQTGKDREDRVEGVINRLALNEDCLEVGLRLNPQATRCRLLKLLGE